MPGVGIGSKLSAIRVRGTRGQVVRADLAQETDLGGATRTAIEPHCQWQVVILFALD